MSGYVWPIEDVREITGLGGRDEDAARAAVSAGAQWIDEHPSAQLVFVKDDDGEFWPGSSDASHLEARLEWSMSQHGRLSALQVETCLRHLNRYWSLPAGDDRWTRYLETMKPIDGVCRYCGERLSPALDNWLERTRCVRCVNSRKGADEIRRMIGGGA